MREVETYCETRAKVFSYVRQWSVSGYVLWSVKMRWYQPSFTMENVIGDKRDTIKKLQMQILKYERPNFVYKKLNKQIFYILTNKINK